MRISLKFTSAILTLSISMLMSTRLVADTVWSGETFGDWRFECAAAAEGLIQCALIQSIIDTETKQAMVSMSFARSPIDGVITVSLLLPLGVDLAENASLRLGAKSIFLPFRICLLEGCLARKTMSPVELRQMAAAQSLIVEFYAVGRSEPATAPASSHGLTEAFQRLGFVKDW